MLRLLLLFLVVYIIMLSDFVSLSICIGVCKKKERNISVLGQLLMVGKADSGPLV